MEYRIQETKISLIGENEKELAVITFPKTDDSTYCIDHTFVDDSLRGQGIAGKLVAMAVEEIKKNGGIVTAVCPYAVKWLEKNES